MTTDEAWLRAQMAGIAAPHADSRAAIRLRGLLRDWAVGFSGIRTDVASPTVTRSRRGLLDDESSSFLRALDSRFITVDGQSSSSCTVRPKTPVGRYALLSKSGARSRTRGSLTMAHT